MRVRGLKLAKWCDRKQLEQVAPHAGAWIETFEIRKVLVIAPVAPHAGAWIETHTRTDHSTGRIVAPHAGAWIETTTCL